MQALLSSPWIESLGWALLHSLWQISVVAIALALLRALFPQPRIRHSLAMLALMGSAGWPTVTLIQNWPEVPVVTTALPASAGIQEPQSEPELQVPAMPQSAPEMMPASAAAKSPGLPVSWRQRLDQAAPWLAGLWLAGLGVLTLRHLGALWILRRLRTRAVSQASPALQETFDRLKTRLGVRRAIQLLVSARACTPMIIGTLRPVILVPASLATGLDPVQLEALLAHELAHLRRWDDVINLMQCAIETLLFYHPAVWWMAGVAREDRELCCDDLAVKRGVEPGALAQALAHLAIGPLPVPQPSLAATGGRGQVVGRIRRLLQPASPRFSLSIWPVILVLAAVLQFMPGRTSGADGKEGSKSNADQNAAANGWRGRILDRHGVVLAESSSLTERHYPGKGLAAHVIGYTAQAYGPDKAPTGRTGIERSVNDDLSKGEDVTLTLDADLQRSVEDILAAKARGGAACVVMDPRTGEVLALASWPTFDLNRMLPPLKQEEYDKLAKAPNVPLLGRAFQGNYFPGGMFKLVTALAGLDSGDIDEKTLFNGDPSFQIGDRTFHNWSKSPEGPLDVVGAIKRSTNTWFYQAGLKTGASHVTDMGQRLGFGKPAGLPLDGEAKGFMPSDEHYEKRYGHKILPGILASIAIGQVAEASPMQVAAATCAIANGETVWRPRLTSDQTAWTASNELKMDFKRLEPVRKGMLAAVNEKNGVANKARIDGIEVAGITSTAQWKVYEESSKNRHLAWFTGFAPYDRPKVVVTIVYEGAPGEAVSGGALAAPLAAEVIQKALARVPAEPLKYSARLVEPLATRFNYAWFSAASVKGPPSNQGGLTRVFLPPPQPGSDPNKPRYDCALVLTKEVAQLFEGDVTVIPNSDVVTIEKRNGVGEIVRGKARLGSQEFRGVLNAESTTIFLPPTWPPLWRTMLTTSLLPTQPPAPSDAGKPKRARASAAQTTPLPARFQSGGYKPETLLMADGTTRGFVRGTFPWAPLPPEVPASVTFTPAGPDIRTWNKNDPPAPFVTPPDLKGESGSLPAQLRDVDSYRRLQSPSALPDPVRVDLHLPDLSPGPLDPAGSSDNIFPPLPKTLDAITDPLMSTPPSARGTQEEQFRKMEETLERTEERVREMKRAAEAFRLRNRAENNPTAPSSTSPRPAPSS